MKKNKNNILVTGSYYCSSVETNRTSIHEDAGSILGLIQLVGIWCCLELWYSSHVGSDPMLLWL